MSNESKYTIASRLAEFLRRNGEKVINGSCKLSLTTSALCLLNTLFAETLTSANSLDISNTLNSLSPDVADDVKFLFDFMKKTSSLKVKIHDDDFHYMMVKIHQQAGSISIDNLTNKVLLHYVAMAPKYHSLLSRCCDNPLCQLFHGVQTLRGGIDLSHFSNLNALELRKIPAHLIIGLDILSYQLKSLNVSRSLYLLKEIFGAYGEEESLSNTWLELKELNLSYNYLETLDASLQSLPNVEVINLSHNHLRDVTEIQGLKRLFIVNFSYNDLSCLPKFDINSCRTLTKLYCRNNNLENLEGLDCLFNLEELDVGYNLLSEYHVLQPLDKLKSLKMLNLEGNPLHFHRRHMTLVAGYVSKNVLHNGFLLNGHMFSIALNEVSETQFKEIQVQNQHQTSINTVVGDTDSIVSAPYDPHHFGKSYSDQSSCEDNHPGSKSYEGDEPIVHVQRLKKSRQKGSKAERKKKKNISGVMNNGSNESIQGNVDQVDNAAESSVPSHLKTKALMEARREELGHAWLIPDSAFQRVMLPTPDVPANTPASSSLPTIQTVSQMSFVEKVNISFANQAAESQEKAKTPALNDQPEAIEKSVNENTQDSCSEQSDPKENDDIEILSSHCEPDCCSGDLHGTLSQDNLSECDIYENNELSYVDEFEDTTVGEDSDEESEDSIFFVTRQDEFSENAISLYIGPNYIKEKNFLTAKVIDRLDLKCLLSVITSSKEKNGTCCCEVQLEFNTLKSSRRSRIYVFDDFESGMLMANKVQPFADANTLEEVTLGALECVKCKSQFSKQVAKKILIKDKKPNEVTYSSSYDSNKVYCREVDACPNCENHILINLDTFPMPGVRPSPVKMDSSKGISNSSPLNKSPSAGGILASLFPSMRISPILKRKSVSVAPNELTQSLNLPSCSTLSEMNLSQSNETDEPETMRRISSDMTIMSNTSQSSIAVISDPDINLHTIVEQHSQSSLSSPISHESTYYKANSILEVEGVSENMPVNGDTLRNQVDHPELNINEPDFYSLSETSTHSKNLETNERSSESNYFLFPSKNTASDVQNTDSNDESKEVDEVSNILNILGEKRTVTHEAFSEIDHRLKLHLDINVFKDNEELEACLQTSIVPLLTGDEFSGLFAITSKKIYVLRFLPSYKLTLQLNESVEKAVQIVHSTPLNQLKQIKVILGSQGLIMAFGPSARVFTLMIRDADICNSFTSLISDFIQEHASVCSEVEFLSSAEDTLPALKDSVFPDSEEMPEILLHLFAFWGHTKNLDSYSSQPVCIIVTSEEIFISRILNKKQDSVQDLTTFCTYHYTSVSSQKLSDLVSLKLKKDLKSVEIHFINESSIRGDEFWTFKMETKSALFYLVSALKTPWEEIFSVPLSLTCEEDD